MTDHELLKQALHNAIQLCGPHSQSGEGLRMLWLALKHLEQARDKRKVADDLDPGTANPL